MPGEVPPHTSGRYSQSAIYAWIAPRPHGAACLAGMIRALTAPVKTMNRQKKLQQLFKAKAKKASAKLAPKSKDRYISKAERERLAAEAAEAPSPSPEA